MLSWTCPDQPLNAEREGQDFPIRPCIAEMRKLSLVEPLILSLPWHSLSFKTGLWKQLSTFEVMLITGLWNHSGLLHSYSQSFSILHETKILQQEEQDKTQWGLLQPGVKLCLRKRRIHIWIFGKWWSLNEVLKGQQPGTAQLGPRKATLSAWLIWSWCDFVVYQTDPVGILTGFQSQPRT